MATVAVLGEGVTANAVISQLERLGHRYTDQLSMADILVTSPGIPPQAYPPFSGPILSEIEFAYLELKKRSLDRPIIAITGTNGKSTVTSLIAHVLGVPPCGNIGSPFIDHVLSDEAYAVVEVSSYQLESCQSFAPDIALYLNLTPDHLARHQTLDAYHQEKAKITRSQTQDQLFIYHQAYPHLQQLSTETKAKSLALSAEGLSQEDFTQLGVRAGFLQDNYQAAFLALINLGLSKESIIKHMGTFKGLPHRLEKVCTYQGRTFYNDSKATNPESTLAAVNGFSEGIHLILSGDDKGLDMAEFLKDVSKKAKSISYFGGLSDPISKLSTELNLPNFDRVQSMEDAVKHAYDLSAPGDVILFSPSSSSFDCFKNFEHRGDCFRTWVNNTYTA